MRLLKLIELPYLRLLLCYLSLIGVLYLLGDRCQISAVVLTASRNVWGVAVGGALGMGICCALAAFAGVLLTGKISEAKMMVIGAILFFLFAVESIFEAKNYYFESHAV